MGSLIMNLTTTWNQLGFFMLIGQEAWNPKNQLMGIISYKQEELLVAKVKGKITLHFPILKLNTS